MGPETLDLDRLTAAADFAQLCGGTENAVEALEAAEAIYETMREAETGRRGSESHPVLLDL